VYVATKVPPIEWPERPDVPVSEAFTADWIVECAERSLAHLGLDTIDLLQLHAWLDPWLEQGDWADGVERLRKDGKIQHFGVSVEEHNPQSAIRLVRSGLVDTVQVIYNVFDQSPEDELFSAVADEDVGVIVRVPLDEGGLSGRVKRDTIFPDGDWRNDYFGGDRRAQVEERAVAITADLGIPIDALPEVALRFCLSHPAVSTVIPGMRSVEHVRANVKAAEAGPLSDHDLAILRRHRWEKNFYEDA
jgi:aryl-alcohol dehydrogenase-like predicted oxidoreductase